MMDEDVFRRLHDAALAVRGHAHAPYSRFHVGAAVLLASGEIVTAANMENASYGLSLCAEALALGAATGAGGLDKVRAVVVTGGAFDLDPEREGGAITPCGRCRQLLAETAGVAGVDFPVIATDLTGRRRIEHPVSGWLPHAFALRDPA